jgi:DNA-binding transcriptional LysR family regulator
MESWMAGMNWDDMRYFLALAREGTVSGAGRVLAVKHTTVARRIAALEARLDSRLFDRSAEGYAMTQVAENLFEHAVSMEERALSVEREVFGMDTQLKGPLKLTASHDVLTRLVVRQLPRFREEFPGIDLELIGSSGLMDLAGRQADIALRMTPKPPEYLIGRQVLDLRHGVYASVPYLKKQHSPHTVILWRGDGSEPEWVSKHFRGAGVTLRTDEVTSMVMAVKNHMGLARMPCYIGDSEPSLRRLDVSLTPSDWGVWVLSHVDLRSTARVRVCREFLVEILEEQRDLVEGTKSKYP